MIQRFFPSSLISLGTLIRLYRCGSELSCGLSAKRCALETVVYLSSISRSPRGFKDNGSFMGAREPPKENIILAYTSGPSCFNYMPIYARMLVAKLHSQEVHVASHKLKTASSADKVRTHHV